MHIFSGDFREGVEERRVVAAGFLRPFSPGEDAPADPGGAVDVQLDVAECGAERWIQWGSGAGGNQPSSPTVSMVAVVGLVPSLAATIVAPPIGHIPTGTFLNTPREPSAPSV